VSRIESTYKARDVEETIDMYFYRPIGYWIARAGQTLGITPNSVTIVGIFIGVCGGHLLYYRTFTTNVWGIILWVIASTLDSVDGQLARMTNHKSKVGRILDGLADYIIFLNIYLHLFARMVVTYRVGWFPLLLLTLAGLASHSIQSALADYYRNAYVKFVVDPMQSELEDADEVRAEYQATLLLQHPVKKLLLRMYLNYTVHQEQLSTNFQRFRKKVAEEFGNNIPSWLTDEYRRLNKPLMKYFALLATNTRMMVMSVAVLIDAVPMYFATEIIAINLILVSVTLHQKTLNTQLLTEIEKRKALA
jgi:phosphatidylglycerophosphate synthase